MADSVSPRPEIRTLSPRVTRVLIVAAILLALAFSALAAWYYLETERDADLQQRIEQLKREGPPASDGQR